MQRPCGAGAGSKWEWEQEDPGDGHMMALLTRLRMRVTGHQLSVRERFPAVSAGLGWPGRW